MTHSRKNPIFFFKTIKFILSHPLNKRWKGEALLRYVRWQIGSRLIPGEVIFHWIDGTRFIVRPGETGLTQNIYCGLQDFEEMAYILHVLNEEDLFIDVGANSGAYTVLACGVKGARGYSFEPIPSTYQRLKNNIHLNEMADRVKAFNIGLADTEGELLFTSGSDTTNHVVNKDEMTSDIVKVKVLPLDRILAGESPTLIKIDVEGFETLVVNGMLRTLEIPSLHSVIMELNNSGQRYGFNDKDLIEKMRTFGFRMYTYDPFGRMLEPIQCKNTKSGNTLFLRDIPVIQNRLASAPSFKVGLQKI